MNENNLYNKKAVDLSNIILSNMILGLPKKDQPPQKSIPLLAVSGGRDSMLLLHIFSELHIQNHFPKPVVFHLEHGLQKDSQKGLDLIEKECRKLNIPLYYEKRKVDILARRLGKGIEESGRLLRCRLLRRLACKFHPAYAVTAHHADDYLESLLLHFIRGGGHASLDTLSLWNQMEGTAFFRPLVQLSRRQITEITAQCQIPFYDDPSNLSPRFQRNRIRNQIVPLLQKEGLDAVKLWKNFHTQPRICLPKNTDKESVKIEYLSLDRRVFGEGLPLKPLFDAAFLRLGIYPATRRFLTEIQRQAGTKTPFRISYECSQFYLWSGFCGPIWLFSKKADAMRPFRAKLLQKNERKREFSQKFSKKFSQEISLEYNRRKCFILLQQNEKLLSFQEGMRVQLPTGTKKLKKILQEARLPPPVRKCLPLVWNEDTQKVSGILFSFWEKNKDRFFA